MIKLHKMICHQALQRSPKLDKGIVLVRSTPGTILFGHDFSQISVYPATPKALSPSTAPNTSTSMSTFHTMQRSPAEAFAPDQVTVTNNGTGVTNDAIEVLKEIVAAIGETSATITSGRRTPSEQAAAMYANLESTSVTVQKDLYGASGDKVIDVYVAGKAATPAKEAATIRQEMTEKIKELGPSKVSRHCSENSVIDVAPSSITNDAQFQKKALAHTRVTKYLGPGTTPSDPAHHLEIT